MLGLRFVDIWPMVSSALSFLIICSKSAWLANIHMREIIFSLSRVFQYQWGTDGRYTATCHCVRSFSLHAHHSDKVKTHMKGTHLYEAASWLFWTYISKFKKLMSMNFPVPHILIFYNNLLWSKLDLRNNFSRNYSWILTEINVDVLFHRVMSV